MTSGMEVSDGGVALEFLLRALEGAIPPVLLVTSKSAEE